MLGVWGFRHVYVGLDLRCSYGIPLDGGEGRWFFWGLGRGGLVLG